MTWRTHVLGGIASLWFLAIVPSAITVVGMDPMGADAVAGNLGLLATVATVGALLPDLDSHDSKLRHLNLGIGFEPFVLPGHFMSRLFSHREMLHSALGIALCALLFSLPLSLWLGWQAGFALLLGYTSHIALDSCTITGVPFLYPDMTKRWLLPKPWRFLTGSQAEEVLLAPLAFLVFALLLSQLMRVYYSGL